MATVTRPGTQTIRTTATRTTTTGTTRTTAGKTTVTRDNQVFLFNRDNYTWMIGGIALILIGFALMSGGKSPDPHQFNYDEIFSFRRITLAPVVLLLGFIVEVFAIMRVPKELPVDNIDTVTQPSQENIR